MGTKVAFGIMLAVVFAVVASSSAAVINSSGDAWTWDLPQYADTEFGHGTTALCLEYAPARTAASWAFFRFDIAGLLGANEQFASAKLNLYISGNTGVNPDKYWLYNITESGDQKVSDSMTLNTQPTWADEYFHSGTLEPGTVGTVGWITFETSQILDYVNADADGVISFAVRQGNATGGNTSIVTHEHSSAAVRPQFEYTVEAIPEPATMCGIAMGAVALLRRRKR